VARVHFLNVGQGDCIIIEHNSGRVTMLDICSGNLVPPKEEGLAKALKQVAIQGNFRMCDLPTNPLEYLSLIGKNQIFRFILSHPDMDHLDGFDRLYKQKSISVFWDAGVRKPKPDFEGSPFNEDDWDRYEMVRDGKTGIAVINNLAGSRFKFANISEDESPGGDGLYILAPDKDLVKQASEGGDTNDASFVILYKSQGCKILLPGGAHDATWKHVLTDPDAKDCSILVAPHHGRKSGRDYGFLDTVRPQLSLFGCAPSEHLAYDVWNYRHLAKITNNQAGNVVMEIGEKFIDVFVQNSTFAEKAGGDQSRTNSLGYAFLTRIQANN
jgi:competence protein ComEC